MAKQLQFRQGDVFIKQVSKDAIPEGSLVERDGDKLILAYGEVTGHSHAILEDNVVLIDSGGRKWLSAPMDFVVVHDEHAPVEVPAGSYEVIVQRQHVPQEAPRPVYD